MRNEDLLQWNKAIPFVPYRIRYDSGRTYDIRHPEMVEIGRSSPIIFTFLGEDPDTYEKAEMLSVVPIESIEPAPLMRSA